ncbi:MAG: putative lipoprotein [Labilithrix sp.]|nr:putative lipoprotein [Labilithrix sp.]
MCNGKDAALACRDGHLAAVPCRGALGCGDYQGKASCDDSLASAGDPCLAESDEELACTLDKKQVVVCRGGTFVPHLECRGKLGCSPLGKQVSCDTSIAVTSDACKMQGSSACSEDRKELLVCRDGHFAHHRFCRGDAGCFFRDDAPTCDETRSREGDECGVPGYVVCSVDGKSELLCQGGRFAFSRACKSTCQVVNGGRGGIDCR